MDADVEWGGEAGATLLLLIWLPRRGLKYPSNAGLLSDGPGVIVVPGMSVHVRLGPTGHSLIAYSCVI